MCVWRRGDGRGEVRGTVEVLLHSKTLATKGEDKRDLPWALSW